MLPRAPRRKPAHLAPLWTVLLVLTAGLGLVLPAPAARAATAATRCPLAAHRGLTTHATENSFRAFKAAVDKGAEYLEMDVQVTRDGHFTLMHDETVNRTTNGTGTVTGKSWAQLRALRLNDGQRVPSLRGVMDMAKPKGTQLLLELKWVPGSRFAALHRLVESYGADKVVVHSFSRWVVEHYRAAYPTARTGLDVSRTITVRDARRHGGVLPDYRNVTDRWIGRLHHAGVPTYLSTLNSRDAWRRFTGKVTVVVTDKVVEYGDYRDRRCG